MLICHTISFMHRVNPRCWNKMLRVHCCKPKIKQVKKAIWCITFFVNNWLFIIHGFRLIELYVFKNYDIIMSQAHDVTRYKMILVKIAIVFCSISTLIVEFAVLLSSSLKRIWDPCSIFYLRILVKSSQFRIHSPKGLHWQVLLYIFGLRDSCKTPMLYKTKKLVSILKVNSHFFILQEWAGLRR